jgi:molybdenum cofactor synthesis domain-containing protein
MELSLPLRVAILVASDSVSQGTAQDTSGKTAAERMKALGHEVVELAIVSDEVEMIRQKLLRWCDDVRVDLILTSGGTGLSPRDVTPEATLAVIERQVPGIAEALRARGQKKIPTAILSRAVAGTRGSTLIVNLPGSRSGVEESLDVLTPLLPHIFATMRGERH